MELPSSAVRSTPATGYSRHFKIFSQYYICFLWTLIQRLIHTQLYKSSCDTRTRKSGWGARERTTSVEDENGVGGRRRQWDLGDGGDKRKVGCLRWSSLTASSVLLSYCVRRDSSYLMWTTPSLCYIFRLTVNCLNELSSETPLSLLIFFNSSGAPPGHTGLLGHFGAFPGFLTAYNLLQHLIGSVTFWTVWGKNIVIEYRCCCFTFRIALNDLISSCKL